MKILLRYTIKTLQENKKRTFLTLVGIIISVAMITAVSCIVFSLTEFFVNRAVNEYGNWEIVYKDCTVLQQNKLAQDPRVNSVFLVQEGGYAQEPTSQNERKPYLNLRYFSHEALSQLPVKLIQGRLPENSNEVVLSRHLSTDGKVSYQIGDKIEGEFGTRISLEEYSKLENVSYLQEEETLIDTKKKTLTVTGIVERMSIEERYNPGYTIVSLLDEAVFQPTATTYVHLRQVQSSLIKLFPQLEDQILSVNNSVVRARQAFWKTDYFSLIGTSAILTLFVILVGSVSLIYNAFSISLAQRSRQFGLLASIGATARQRRQCVWMEAIILTVIALPIGILSGYCGIAITIQQISPAFQELFYDYPLYPVMNSSVILMSCLFSMITILLSTLRPARLAARFTPIQAIRMDQEFMVRKKGYSSKWIRKIGNVEAEFAYKNFRRNGRKTRVTLFSLSISLVLFTTVTAFVILMMKTITVVKENHNYDFLIYDYGNFSENAKKILDFKLHDSYQLVKQVYGQIDLDTSILTYQAVENLDNLNEVSIYAVDDSTYLQILKEASVSDQQMNQTNPYPVLVLNQFEGKIIQEYKEFEILKTVPQNWQIYLYQQEKLVSVQFDTVGVVDDFHLLEGKSQDQNGRLSFLVSRSTMEQISELSSHKREVLYLKTTQSEALTAKLDELSIQANSSNLTYYDVGEEEKTSRMIVQMMSVLSYGFITLITLISLTNVANTLITNVTLRRKEFAMLKSVGMTPKSFKRMIYLESIYYGIVSTLVAIPFSYLLYLFLFASLQIDFRFNLALITQLLVLGGLVLIAITCLLMQYAVRSIKKENIVDVLKEDQY